MFRFEFIHFVFRSLHACIYNVSGQIENYKVIVNGESEQIGGSTSPVSFGLKSKHRKLKGKQVDE